MLQPLTIEHETEESKRGAFEHIWPGSETDSEDQETKQDANADAVKKCLRNLFKKLWKSQESSER